MAEPDFDALLKLLRESLSALAMPGSQAPETLDPRALRPDELALDYDAVYPAVVGNFASRFSSSQIDALELVDTLLSAMSGHEHAELWTESAVISSPRWTEIRRAARGALHELEASAAQQGVEPD